MTTTGGVVMKFTALFAAATLALTGVAHAADMDCCKDGKCTCCQKKDEQGKDPNKDMKH